MQWSRTWKPRKGDWWGCSEAQTFAAPRSTPRCTARAPEPSHGSHSRPCPAQPELARRRHLRRSARPRAWVARPRGALLGVAPEVMDPQTEIGRRRHLRSPVRGRTCVARAAPDAMTPAQPDGGADICGARRVGRGVTDICGAAHGVEPAALEQVERPSWGGSRWSDDGRHLRSSTQLPRIASRPWGVPGSRVVPEAEHGPSGGICGTALEAEHGALVLAHSSRLTPGVMGAPRPRSEGADICGAVLEADTRGSSRRSRLLVASWRWRGRAGADICGARRGGRGDLHARGRPRSRSNGRHLRSSPLTAPSPEIWRAVARDGADDWARRRRSRHLRDRSGARAFGCPSASRTERGLRGGSCAQRGRPEAEVAPRAPMVDRGGSCR